MNIPYLDLKTMTALHAEEIQTAVARVVSSGRYLQGECVRKFEQHYAAYIGTKHCVGVANGLDALTLTLRSYMEMGRIRPGAEALVPANTFLATVLAITDNGLKPVFIDVDKDTLEMNSEQVAAAINEKTAALMLVHLYGRNTYSEGIARLCRQAGLLLLEDNAQAHGCRCGNKKTGALGDAACHSFYPGKNLGALGDGGAVTTDDALLAETLSMLANYGFEQKYVAKYQGRNSRLDEVQAAVLDVKLQYLDQDNLKRQTLARIYEEGISHPQIRLPKPTAEHENVYHIFPVFTTRRDELQAYLLTHGIQTLIHYPIPPHRQTCYQQWNALSFPITEQLALEELSLPLNPTMSEDDIKHVIAIINQF